MLKTFSLLTLFICLVAGQGATGPGVPDQRCPLWDNPSNPMHLPHSRYCNRFYKCSGGLRFPFNCPPGQHWSVGLNRCDWPAVANCTLNGGGGPRCPVNDDPWNPTLLPHAYDCSRFYFCANGHPHPRQCPPGQHFGVAINRCDWPQVAGCEGHSSQQCPADNSVPTFFPHETDCGLFYICNWGNRELRSCPPGQHWWQQMSRCDWEWFANCSLTGTTTTARTTTARTTTSRTTTRRSA